MNIFSGFVKMITGGLVSDIGDAIDKNVTSDEERLALRNELAKITQQVNERAMEYAEVIEQNVTARHQADMTSDSAFAKNIRPAVLSVLTIFTLIFAAMPLVKELTDYSFQAWKASLSTLVSLDMLVYGFYFGSRGVEKIATKLSAYLGGK